MKPLFPALLAVTLGLVPVSGFAASADELIQACEKLKRADDRATCLKEAVRASAGAPATSRPQSRKGVVTASADAIMKSLRRLANATSVGINLRDYSQMVVVESALINEELRGIPRGPFEDHVRRARDTYLDAREVWSKSIEWDDVLTFRIAAGPILQRYRLDVPLPSGGGGNTKTAALPISMYLSPIWAAAREDATVAQAAVATIMNPPTPAPLPSSTAKGVPSGAVGGQATGSDEQRRASIAAAGERAMRLLREFDDVANIDTGLSKYADFLWRRYPEFDRALSVMPDGIVKRNLAASKQAYASAGETWALSNMHPYLSQFAEAAGPILQRYGVTADVLNSVGTTDMKRMPKHVFLDPIWRVARQRLDDADDALKAVDAGGAGSQADAPRQP